MKGVRRQRAIAYHTWRTVIKQEAPAACAAGASCLITYPEDNLRERLWLGATYTGTGFLTDTTF
jgi:hypothetical protein